MKEKRRLFAAFYRWQFCCGIFAIAHDEAETTGCSVEPWMLMAMLEIAGCLLFWLRLVIRLLLQKLFCICGWGVEAQLTETS